jgi:hypothetical protein
MIYSTTYLGRTQVKIMTDTFDVIVDAPEETLHEWVADNCNLSIRFERILPDCTDIEQTYRTVSDQEYAENHMTEDDWKRFAKWVHEQI